MTKNRARKQDVRQRMNHTGESFADANTKLQSVSGKQVTQKDLFEYNAHLLELLIVRTKILRQLVKDIVEADTDVESLTEPLRVRLFDYYQQYVLPQKRNWLSELEEYVARQGRPLEYKVVKGSARAATVEDIHYSKMLDEVFAKAEPFNTEVAELEKFLIAYVEDE